MLEPGVTWKVFADKYPASIVVKIIKRFFLIVIPLYIKFEDNCLIIFMIIVFFYKNAI